MLRDLRLLLIESKDAEEPPEATVRKVEAVSPGFAQTLRGVVNDPDRFTKVLVALIALLTSIVESGHIDISVSAFNTFVTNIAPISAHDQRNDSGEREGRKDPNSSEDRPKQ